MSFVPGSGVLVTPRTFSRFHYQGKTNGVDATGLTMMYASRLGPIPAHWLAYLPCPAGAGVGGQWKYFPRHILLTLALLENPPISLLLIILATSSQPAVSIMAAPGQLGQLPAMLESVRAPLVAKVVFRTGRNYPPSNSRFRLHFCSAFKLYSCISSCFVPVIPGSFSQLPGWRTIMQKSQTTWLTIRTITITVRHLQHGWPRLPTL